MPRGAKARAARRAATAIAMKKAGKKPSPPAPKKKKKKFPGDVNHDGKITGVDFKIARARGMI